MVCRFAVKAVGFLQVKKRGGPSEVFLLEARGTIASAIDNFFAAFFSQGNNTFVNGGHASYWPCLRRSERLIYLVSEDSIKTTVGKSQEAGRARRTGKRDQASVSKRATRRWSGKHRLC